MCGIVSYYKKLYYIIFYNTNNFFTNLFLPHQKINARRKENSHNSRKGH